MSAIQITNATFKVVSTAMDSIEVGDLDPESFIERVAEGVTEPYVHTASYFIQQVDDSEYTVVVFEFFCLSTTTIAQQNELRTAIQSAADSRHVILVEPPPAF